MALKQVVCSAVAPPTTDDATDDDDGEDHQSTYLKSHVLDISGQILRACYVCVTARL